MSTPQADVDGNRGSGSVGRFALAGHVFFAATLIGVGIMLLVRGELTAIWSGVPKGFPARHALAYLCSVISLVCGIGLLLRRAAAAASAVLLAAFLTWFLLFRVPMLFRAPGSSGVWWACGETAALIAGAWVLCARFAHRHGREGVGFVVSDRGLSFARTLYGLSLVPFGIAHFTFFQRTVGMVPAWMPGHVFWACFTGGAFIAAGIAAAVGVFPRLATALSAWEMGLFTVLVWIPVMMARPGASDWVEFVDSCVLTGVGWVVAESWRGTPWLALGRGDRVRRFGVEPVA